MKLHLRQPAHPEVSEHGPGLEARRRPYSGSKRVLCRAMKPASGSGSPLRALVVSEPSVLQPVEIRERDEVGDVLAEHGEPVDRLLTFDTTPGDVPATSKRSSVAHPLTPAASRASRRSSR